MGTTRKLEQCRSAHYFILGNKVTKIEGDTTTTRHIKLSPYQINQFIAIVEGANLTGFDKIYAAQRYDAMVVTGWLAIAHDVS